MKQSCCISFRRIKCVQIIHPLPVIKEHTKRIVDIISGPLSLKDVFCRRKALIINYLIIFFRTWKTKRAERNGARFLMIILKDSNIEITCHLKTDMHSAFKMKLDQSINLSATSSTACRWILWRESFFQSFKQLPLSPSRAFFVCFFIPFYQFQALFGHFAWCHHRGKQNTVKKLK